LANGERVPIKDVKVGDQVLATDPETGETGAREVIATLPHVDQLLTLRASSGEIVTTEDHKYWNETDREWQESQDLDPGDRLLTADGDEVTVEGLDWATLHTDAAYDLDNAGIDTYYVGAGDESVLVHNCNIARINADDLPAVERAALDDTVRNIDAGTVPTGPTSNRWGTTFHNREGHLPAGGSYREFRVAPSPGTSGAGPLRVVVDDNTGSMYYTWTHYGDAGSPAFVQIR
jgi:guanyl-specific ribonuclease Sa